MAGRSEYASFAELCSNRTRGTDFRTEFVHRGTELAVIAPHDGKIEPHTGKIAKAIAGDDYSHYVFTSLTSFQCGYTDHITSSRFDDPDALKIVGDVDWVLAIHGRKDRDEPETVWVGGLDEKRRDRMIHALQRAGFSAREEVKVHGGLHKKISVIRLRTKLVFSWKCQKLCGIA